MNHGPSPSEDRGDPNDRPAHLRARVPDHVSDGVFSTGVIVMTGPSEYVLDFLQTVGRPHRVAARVVLPHPVMPQFIDALRKNLDLYQQRFGPPPAPPAPSPEAVAGARRPTPQEIYDDLKMNDALLSGAYANGVMIGHGASEFSLDFLTSFFPQSAVSARVYLAAGQMPRLLESMQNAHQGLLRGRGGSDAAAGTQPPGEAGPNPADPAGPGPAGPTEHPGGDTGGNPAGPGDANGDGGTNESNGNDDSGEDPERPL